MSTRINVTAVRDCPVADIRAVMSETIRLACAEAGCSPIGDQLEIHEHNGWAWFMTSVWGVSALDLDRGLCKLARPALQFTTSDGDRWYLTMHGGPQGQVRFVHEFGYHSHAVDPADDAERQALLEQHEEPPEVDPRLAFLHEDRPAGPERPKVAFDLAAGPLIEMGAHIPDAFRQAVADLPYSAALNRYREWHAEEVSNALSAAGIPHDHGAVQSVLLWENVTGSEVDSDLGNLPRLLSVLGLGGSWDDWVRQAEAPAPPPEAEAEPAPDAGEEHASATSAGLTPAPEDPIAPVLEIVGPLGLTPVRGGPVAVPLADLPLLRFFVEALSIHDTAGVVLAVTLPPGSGRALMATPAGAGAGVVELTGDGFRLGLDNHLWFNRDDLMNQLGEELAGLLDDLPDGSAIDMAYAHAGRPALDQRYRGGILDRTWRIRETYPPLDRRALAEGLELARYAAAEHETHELLDEAEARAVIELARRDPTLWDMRVQQDGQRVWCKSDIVGHLPKVIFRHRFARYWDVAAHDREAARLYEERVRMQRRMRRARAEMARRRAAPHDSDVLLRGRLGLYWRSDLARLDELEQETRERIDGAFAGLGFQHVGDMVAKKQRDIVVRTFASADRLSLGVVMAKRTIYLGVEFFSRFEDGSNLTTTTNAATSSRPQLKVYIRAHPGLEPPTLYDKHRWGIDRFRTHKATQPVPLEASLVGVAREYDAALARREGIALRFRIVAPPPGEPPPHIRAAWVGCVLPLYATTDDPKISKQSTGVLSGRKSDHPPGFAVQVLDALNELERHHAAAAQWWREHAPHALKPGKLMVFAEDVCELSS
jgi:hypothetical protein